MVPAGEPKQVRAWIAVQGFPQEHWGTSIHGMEREYSPINKTFLLPFGTQSVGLAYSFAGG